MLPKKQKATAQNDLKAKSKRCKMKTISQGDIKPKQFNGNVKRDQHADSKVVHQMPDSPKPKGGQSVSHTRRSSTRLQSRNSSITPGKATLVDSAYDGDGESSPSNTQSEGDDPYSISGIEDVPAILKGRKKKQGKIGPEGKQKKTHPASKRSGTKRVSSSVAPPSSTPSLSGAPPSSTPNLAVQPPRRRSTRNSLPLESTPEITPILPVKPMHQGSPSGQTFSTPQIYHQLTSKTSPAVTLSSPSPSLQCSSQADSGIAVSPPAKRARVQPGEPRHKTAAVKGKKFMNKRNIFSPNPKHQKNENTPAETKENMDSSCFGFNTSMDSPGMMLSGHQKKLPVSATYRSTQPITSDSSPVCPVRPLASTDSDNWPDSSSQQRMWPSPSLYSDDVLSADSESVTVNKSTVQTYKPSKVKKLKHKKPNTKFEAWANEINMEIEDIEKFELNIE